MRLETCTERSERICRLRAEMLGASAARGRRLLDRDEQRFCGACREALAGEEERTALRRVIEGDLRHGGFHLRINLAGVEELREALRQTESHRGLMVRISGFSVAFVSLEPAGMSRSSNTREKDAEMIRRFESHTQRDAT